MGAAFPATNVTGIVADSLGLDKNLCRQAYEDGSEYYGQFQKRQFHGRGRMRWNAGDGKVDEYDGHWENGRMHGQGVYKYFDGTRYQGQFRDNLREGYGILTFTDGSLYEGGWSEDVPEGEGRVIYSSGQIVSTTFKAGQQSMERLETLVKEAVPPPPTEGMDFVPIPEDREPASSSTAPAILNDDRPPLPPPEPYSMVADRPDMSLPIADGDSLARLPVLALTNIPPPPPLGTTAPLPALRAPGPAGAAGSSPLGASPVGATPLGASPPGASPLGASPLGASPLGASPLGASPLGASPLGASPLGASPPNAAPRRAWPLGAAPQA